MQNQRTKICPNCEGNVALEVSICPYCASNVFEKSENARNIPDTDNVKSLSFEETLESLYPPPYKPKAIDPEEELVQEDTRLENEQEEEIETEKSSTSLFATTFFLLGINIFVFSLLLLLFSKDGILSVQFNAKYWFLYMLGSLPIIFLGFMGLQKLD